MTHKVQRALKELGGVSQPRGREIPAVMGLGNGTVEVASNPYMVWVRLYGDQNQPARAWCLDVARVDGLPIMVAHTTSRQGGQTAYEVVGFGSNEIISNRSDGAPVTFDPYLPQHHVTHEWSAVARGRDPVNVYPRSIAVGRVYATSPPSMVCRVSPLAYMYGNKVKTFAGGNTVDFTGEIPASANRAKLAYICIDGSSNALDYIYSDEFNWTGFIDPLPSSVWEDITPGFVLLSAVILYNGMSTITEACFRYEMRPLFHAVGNAEVSYAGCVVASASDGSLQQIVATSTVDSSMVFVLASY